MFRNITPVVQRLLLINIAIFLAANFFIPVIFLFLYSTIGLHFTT